MPSGRPMGKSSHKARGGLINSMCSLTNPNTNNHKEFMIIKLNKLTQQELPKSDKKMERDSRGIGEGYERARRGI